MELPLPSVPLSLSRWPRALGFALILAVSGAALPELVLAQETVGAPSEDGYGEPLAEPAGDIPDIPPDDPMHDPATDTVTDTATDTSIGLIEAPATARSAGPEGAFALAPERSARRAPMAARARSGPDGGPPVVVELFTAQGCSSCPDADALIAALADLPGVLTLSWHVDYWDYLGWPDAFASPQNTLRQQGYASVAGERGVYTPQIIVDGQDTLLGVDRGALLALIDDHAARPPAVIVTASPVPGGHAIDLIPRAAIPGGVDVLLVRFLPQREAGIDAGENAGRRILYRNVVVGSESLSRWAARTPLRLTVREGAATDASGAYPGDTEHAILVQQVMRGGRPGPILAAIRLD